MYYHPFKKTVPSKNGKTTKRWYYWWKDPITGIQHQKTISMVNGYLEMVSSIQDVLPAVNGLFD